MSASVRIRRATLDDYDALCRLFHQLDEHHVQASPAHFQAFPPPARPHDLLNAKLLNPDGAVFVAEAGEELVGFLDVWKDGPSRAPMFKQVTFAHLENMVVDARYRRQGIAAALLSEARRWAAERGLNSLQLKVYSANTSAVSFYEKEGFVPLALTMELSIQEDLRA